MLTEKKVHLISDDCCKYDYVLTIPNPLTLPTIVPEKLLKSLLESNYKIFKFIYQNYYIVLDNRNAYDESLVGISEMTAKRIAQLFVILSDNFEHDYVVNKGLVPELIILPEDVDLDGEIEIGKLREIVLYFSDLQDDKTDVNKKELIEEIINSLDSDLLVKMIKYMEPDMDSLNGYINIEDRFYITGYKISI